MKTIILLLLSICMFTHSNAQTKTLDTKQELLNLLKSKHDFERVSTLDKGNTLLFEKKYKEYYAKIQGNKRKIFAYIDNALKVDTPALNKEFIFYKYKDPLSSSFDRKNMISLLTYYKIIKYSLETSKNTLLKLSDIPTF